MADGEGWKGGGVPVRPSVSLRLLRLLPQGAISMVWGRLAEFRLPRKLQGRVNRGFARLFDVDLADAAHPPEHYPTLSAFFARTLRPGVRPFPLHGGIPGSPVDGIIGACGPLEEGIAIQAKGITYPVAALLGGGSDAERFRSGLFVTIYLSPRHYHRIHSPLGGVLREARSVPGRLLPVGPDSVRSIPDLFPRNERLVTLMERGALDMAVVAVGAFNVGRISAAFDLGWNGPDGRGVTNRKGGREIEVRRYDPPLPIERGQEIMAFHLGSTVVLLLGSAGGTLPRLAPGLRPGEEVRMGSPLLQGPVAD
ncbi:MAG: phosphatidylserine decarboxylase [Gemmatimonadetes bacterium]|nr:phosphatidylserine decarboxylase [Gemmatimonadota bacterium]